VVQVAKDHYYHYDALGSVVGLSDEDGYGISNYEYDAFGNVLASVDMLDNNFQFSSKEWEAHAGLIYFGARYYDPEAGRWLTPDPLGVADGLNVYAYVGNNPTNLVDPYGLWDVRTRGLGNPWLRVLADLYYHKDKIKGRHWQMFYDDGTDVGYLGDDPKNPSRPRIGSDENGLLRNYSSTALIHGENDELMKVAEIRATDYWENEYKKGQRYHHPVLFDRARRFDCQDFIIRMLYEYNKIARTKAGKEHL